MVTDLTVAPTTTRRCLVVAEGLDPPGDIGVVVEPVGARMTESRIVERTASVRKSFNESLGLVRTRPPGHGCTSCEDAPDAWVETD